MRIQFSIDDILDELASGSSRIPSDDEMQRVGCVFHEQDRVEGVVIGVEVLAVQRHLNEAERNNNRAIRPLFLHHLRGDVVGIADASHPDLPCIAAEILGRRPHVSDKRQQQYPNENPNVHV